MQKQASIVIVSLSLAMFLGTLYLFCNIAVAQEKPAPKKPQWEYKVIEALDNSRKLEQEIAKASEDRWELIGVVSSVKDNFPFSVRKGDSTGSLSVNTTVKLIVKREKQ